MVSPMPRRPCPRASASRARAIRRFRWSILPPLIALFALVLLPVLFLQLYFSFHQWTVYLGSWWEAEFVGLDLFKEVLTDERFGWAIVRSLAFATGSTIGCFVLGFALAYLMHKPFPRPGVLSTSSSSCRCSLCRSSSPIRPRCCFTRAAR